MNLKEFFERLIRGWIPEEPKMPKNMLKKPRMPIASYLKFTTLKIVYALTLGFVATWFLGYLIIYYWKDAWTGSIVSVFLHSLPFLFVINALPLTIFAVVFLTKGGGAYYFRSWNAGKKLQLSGYAIVSGYISVMLPHLLNIHSFISPSNTQDYIQALLNIYSIFACFGLSLMAIGFGSLFVLYKKSASSKKATDASGEGTKVKKTKTTKKTLVLVFVIAVLTVSLVCLAGVHLKLQRDYDDLSESFRFATESKAWIVNEEWTDNVGVDSNYVNYKGGIINFGYKTAYNVTLLVSIRGIDDTLLRREEIFIGDVIGPWGYQAFDVNIEYSGELSKVSAGTRWD